MIEKLALVGTVGAGLAIGLLWPSTGHSIATAARAGSRDVIISRSSDLHYYADAKVNGHGVHFMVDTGDGKAIMLL